MGFKKLLTCISNVLHFKSENFRLSSFSAKKKKKLKKLKIVLLVLVQNENIRLRNNVNYNLPFKIMNVSFLVISCKNAWSLYH